MNRVVKLAGQMFYLFFHLFSMVSINHELSDDIHLAFFHTDMGGFSHSDTACDIHEDVLSLKGFTEVIGLILRDIKKDLMSPCEIVLCTCHWHVKVMERLRQRLGILYNLVGIFMAVGQQFFEDNS